MKIKFLFFLIVFTTFCNAQIVSIPNTTFKARLLSANSSNTIAKDINGNYIDIDSNNDNEIQESEALQVKELKLIESINVTSIEGINSFLNITKLEIKFNGLTYADLTALNQLNYIDLYCGNINLGTKNNLETLYVIHTNSIVYTSTAATLKKITSSLNLFSSINYLLKLNLEEIKIQNFTMQMGDFDYSNLKYMYNLRILDLGLTDGSNLNFTNYNPLENPLYPQNIKTLILKNLHQNLNIINLNSIENLEFYSVDINVFETYESPYLIAVQTFNPANFPNLKSLNFIRYYNGIQNLDLSPLTHLETFITSEAIVYTGYNGSVFNINFGNNNNLKKVVLNELPTANLNFSGNTNLEELEIYANKEYYHQSAATVNVTFSNNNNIKKIKAHIPYRTEQTFWNNHPRNIEFINLNNNNSLERLDLNFCNLVQPLVLNNNNFNYFNAFRCIFNNTVTFGNLPNFSYLNIETLAAETYVSSLATNDLILDLSGCTILTSLDVHYPKLRFISLKNGIAQTIFGVDLSNDNQGLTICIDSFEQPIIVGGNPFGWNVPLVHAFTNTCTLGLDENEFYNTISMYPNPVTDNLYFQSKENILKIEIYDVAGRIISSKSILENKVNLSELKKGNYFLKLYTKNGIMNYKIIKE